MRSHTTRSGYQNQAGGKPIYLKQVGSLHKELRHLPFSIRNYYYDKNVIVNLLSFAKLADEYYIIYNTRVKDVIYVQSKEDRKYSKFHRDPKYGLYYMDISKANVEDHCYLNAVNKGRLMFSILNQKQTKALKFYKNDALSCPTKILSSGWNVIPQRGQTLKEEM